MLEKFIGRLVICLLKYLNTYNQYVKNKYFRAKSKYQFLTPNDKAENVEEYSKALEEALSEKKVKNIAITGSYGSGKSSFIKTFKKTMKIVYMNFQIFPQLDLIKRVGKVMLIHR